MHHNRNNQTSEVFKTSEVFFMIRKAATITPLRLNDRNNHYVVLG